MDAELEALRVRYEAERHRLDRLRDAVHEILDHALRSHGVVAHVEARTKDTLSLLKKAFRKRFADPWREIEDKVGVRVVVTYASDVQRVRRVVGATLQVGRWEDKSIALPPNALGYVGLHAIASLKPDESTDLADVLDIACEVQVHTKAQSLWAAISHELLYKADIELDRQHERSVFRLVALAELIDSEAARCKEELMKAPGYEVGRVVSDLERHFRRFTAAPVDRELSSLIVRALLPYCESATNPALRARLDAFVAKREGALRRVYGQYQGDSRHLLMSQPESLLVFEELERDRFAFADAWGAHFSTDLIDGLASAWGSPLPVD